VLGIFASSDYCTFITDIHNIGSTEAWSQGSQLASILCLIISRINDDLPKMDIKDFSTLLNAWQANLDLPIKPARSQQRSIQTISSVSSREHND
jgi:hypothetical protein